MGAIKWRIINLHALRCMLHRVQPERQNYRMGRQLSFHYWMKNVYVLLATSIVCALQMREKNCIYKEVDSRDFNEFVYSNELFDIMSVNSVFTW